MDVVNTNAGDISGTVIGEPGYEVCVFRGIPYAAPPVGELRWKPPQPVTPWSGVRECTVCRTHAPQSNILGFKDERPGSEDCLYLNVLTPAKSSDDELPVMVWLHGGGLIQGCGNDYNSLTIPSNGAVLVTVNTRLGPLGLLAHSLLSQESPQHVSGNYLFLDIITSLRWVQENVSSFGGDPSNVTIFGESGGSTKVVNIMASPLAEGLFHKAICESGDAIGTNLKEMESRGEKLFVKLGVDSENDPLSAARALPWKKIIEVGEVLDAELGILPLGMWDSTVDGWFLTDTPAKIFKNGRQNVVPFIAGGNLGELTGPGFIIMPQVIPGYVNLYKGANRTGGKAYAYVFDRVPESWKREGVVSTHAMELPYIFGLEQTRYDGRDIWELIFKLATLSGVKSPVPVFSEDDRRVSELMINMWTNFAKTGNPSIEDEIEWPTWEEEGDQYLYITERPEVREGFSKVV